jgi:WD40 repeat protein
MTRQFKPGQKWNAMRKTLLLPFAVLGLALAHFAGSANAVVDTPRNNLEVTSASFSPNGKRLVVALQQTSGLYTGPKWKMWDVKSGKEIKTNWPNYDFQKKYPNVFFISYLPDGKRILTVEFPNIWRIWDAEKIAVLREFTCGIAAPIGPSADGSKILAVSRNGLGAVDMKTGHARITITPEMMSLPHSLWFNGGWRVSPDAHWAIVARPTSLGYVDLRLKKTIYDAKDYFSKTNAEKQQPFLSPLLFSPDSKTVLAAKMKGVKTSGVAICDAANLKVIKEIPDVNRVLVAAFTTDGKKLLIHDAGYPPRLRCWDTNTCELLWTIPKLRAPAELKLIVPCPQGDLVLLVNRLLVGGQRNNGPGANMVLMSAKTGETVSRLDTDVFPSENFPDPNAEK